MLAIERVSFAPVVDTLWRVLCSTFLINWVVVVDRVLDRRHAPINACVNGWIARGVQSCMGPNLFSRSSGSTGIIILAQPCPACPSTLLLDLFVESQFGWLLFNIDSHNSNSPCDSRKVIRRARDLTEAPQAPARTVDRSSAALDLRPGPAALSRCKRWWHGANRAACLDSTPQRRRTLDSGPLVVSRVVLVAQEGWQRALPT